MKPLLPASSVLPHRLPLRMRAMATCTLLGLVAIAGCAENDAAAHGFDRMGFDSERPGATLTGDGP